MQKCEHGSDEMWCDKCYDNRRSKRAEEEFGVPYAEITGYMRDAFVQTDKVVAELTQVVRDKGIEFDTLVGTGLSGTLLLRPLSLSIFNRDDRYAVIRKKKEGSHSGNMVEGWLGRRYVFVDDLIDSGETIARVEHTIAKELKNYPFKAECVGALLYESFSGDMWKPRSEIEIDYFVRREYGMVSNEEERDRLHTWDDEEDDE